ncbi:hypothetical protein ACOSQ3_022712 [Xanthoceras sorbifolium]
MLSAIASPMMSSRFSISATPNVLISHCKALVNTIKCLGHLSCFFSNVDNNSLRAWHNKLGHPSFNFVKQVLRKISLPCSSAKSLDFCDACQCGKLHQIPFPTSQSIYTAPLELIFTDVWGPSPVCSSQGYHYYVHFIDAFSRFTWIYPLSSKSQLKMCSFCFKNLLSFFLIPKSKVFKMIGEENFDPWLLISKV